MKCVHLLQRFFVIAAAVTIVHATINSSVNVHFVPPLVAGYCIFGRWWNPPDVTCATCFCMTGSLSRCFPTPGCNPNQSSPSPTPAASPSVPHTTTVEPTASQKPSSGAATPEESSKPPPTTGAPSSSAASTMPSAPTMSSTVSSATTTTAAARRRPH